MKFFNFRKKIIILLFLLYMYRSELRFVFEMNRHGVTSPKLYPDLNFDVLGQEWNFENELTSTGITNQFHSGDQFRKKYIDKHLLLSQKANPNEVLAISTDTEAAIISSYSKLVGLYPTNSIKKLNDIQSITPISSIQITNIENILLSLDRASLPQNNQIFVIKALSNKDYFHIYNLNSCKPASALVGSEQSRKRVDQFLKNFNNTYYEGLNKVMKFDDKNYLLNYDNVKNILESFVAGKKNNLNFDYLKKEINLENFYQVAIDFMKMDLYDIRLGDEEKLKARIAISKTIQGLNLLLDEMIDKDKKNGEYNKSATNELKYLLYSCLDIELASLLIYLKLSLNTVVYYPEFSSSFFLEFYKNSKKMKNLSDNDYSVKLFFNDRILYEASYHEFKSKTNSLILNQKRIDEYCGYRDNTETSYFLLVSVLGIVSMGLIIWNTILLIKSDLK